MTYKHLCRCILARVSIRASYLFWYRVLFRVTVVVVVVVVVLRASICVHTHVYTYIYTSACVRSEAAREPPRRSYLVSLMKAIKIRTSSFSFSLFPVLVSFSIPAAFSAAPPPKTFPLSFLRNTHSTSVRTPGHVPSILSFSSFFLPAFIPTPAPCARSGILSFSRAPSATPRSPLP